MDQDKENRLVPDYLISEEFEHVQGVLNREPSRLAKLLMLKMTPKLKIDRTRTAKVKDIAATGPVVYAVKYRNLYDVQLMRLKFNELGLPVPCFVFGLNSYELVGAAKFWRVWKHRVSSLYREHSLPTPVNQEALKTILQRGGAALFFLSDEKTTRDRYIHPEQDPINILIDLQSKMGAAIAVVPTFLVYERKAKRPEPSFWSGLMGNPDIPGLFQRLSWATRQWIIPELLIGDPVYLLNEFEEFGSNRNPENLPFDIRRELLDNINSMIRVNRGPESLSRTEIKERVLQDPRVQRAVRHSDDHQEHENKKKAEAFVDEIAADPRGQVHHVLYYVLIKLFDTVFDEIDTKTAQFSMLRETNTKGSLVFVSSHQSHFDYLITGFYCFINQMAIPLMAAGKNLAFWPVGPILRSGGGFFIRRSFRGLSLYMSVFAAYLKVLVQERFNINFYIEGGRSRTGKLLPPKLGMLGFILDSIENGDVEDLYFVPTYVAYDQVPEEKSHLKELAGREKQKESFGQLLQARNVLKKRYGKTYLRFHEPVTLASFCEKAGISKQEFFEDKKMRTLQFAYYLMKAIARATVITPLELAAAALICTGKKEVSIHELRETAHILLTALKNVNSDLDSALITNPEIAITEALATFQKRNFIKVSREQGVDFIEIADAAKPGLYFYKNALLNVISLEVCVAAVLLLEPSATADSLENKVKEIKDLFEKEFIWDELSFREELDCVLNFFLQKELIEQTSNHYSVINPKSLRIYAGLMYDLITAYMWVLEQAGESKKQTARELAKILSKKSIEKQANVAALIPWVPLTAVTNAMSMFAEKGILEYKESRKTLGVVTDESARSELIARLHSYAASVYPMNTPDLNSTESAEHL